MFYNKVTVGGYIHVHGIHWSHFMPPEATMLQDNSHLMAQLRHCLEDAYEDGAPSLRTQYMPESNDYCLVFN